MLRRRCPIRLALPAVLLASPLSAQLSSSSSNVADADCSGLKLIAAGGVPDGSSHAYKFQGICKILSVNYSSDQVVGLTYDTDKDVKVTGQVWATAAVKWESQTGDLTEKVETFGAYAGELLMTLKCAQDPVITSIACQPTAYKNTTGWPGFDGAWAHARPVTRGKTTLFEAAAFSKKKPAGNPASPPPPPPAPKTTPKPGPKSTVPLARTPAVAAPVVSRVVVAPQPPAPRLAVPRVPAVQEIPLVRGARIPLTSGRSLSARFERSGLRWAILGSRGQVMRLFPDGSRAFRSGAGKVTVDWGAGVYDAGVQQ